MIKVLYSVVSRQFQLQSRSRDERSHSLPQGPTERIFARPQSPDFNASVQNASIYRRHVGPPKPLRLFIKDFMSGAA
jgi:hypothetical protein